MKKILMLLILFLPWFLRRILLEKFFGYEIHPTARIRFAWIFPKKLIMGPGAYIGIFTVCKSIDLLHMKEYAIIGNATWITGFPSDSKEYFNNDSGRRPELIIGEHSAIAHRHFIDCTNSVVIGPFTTVAGYYSQILTHTIDLKNSRQSSKPIGIGSYCFVGTNCVILGGSALPNYSALGAKSLLNKEFLETHFLYGGVPAGPIEKLSEDFMYFHRKVGLVK